MIAQSFGAGDAVIYRGMLGTVIDVLPGGVHTVQLTSTGKLVTALTDQLAPADKDNLPTGGTTKPL